MKSLTKHKLVGWALFISCLGAGAVWDAARQCGYVKICYAGFLCWVYLLASLIVHISSDYES